MIDLNKYSGKRIVCFDYGKRRIGYAVSDILHITTKPKQVFINEENYLDEIKDVIFSDDAGLIVIGIPERNDVNTKLVDEIIEFGKTLSELTNIEHVFSDESYSSKQAVERMLSAGKKKKYRREKQNTDMFAAAIILEEFLSQ